MAKKNFDLPFLSSKQCSWAGSVCFWASWIRIHNLFVRIWLRIRTLPSASKKKWRKALISTVLWFLYYNLLSLKNDVNVPSKRNKHKNSREKIIFGVNLKVTDEKLDLFVKGTDLRIRIWDSHKMSWIWNTAFKKAYIFFINSPRVVFLQEVSAFQMQTQERLQLFRKNICHNGYHAILHFKDIINTFISYSSEINAVFCPRRVSLPLTKKRCDIVSSEGCAAYPV